VRIATQRFGANHDLVATFNHNLALLNAEIVTSPRQSARRTGRGHLERLLGREHPFVATASIRSPKCWRAGTRLTRPAPFSSAPWQSGSRRLKPGHHDLAITQMNLARTLFRLGRVTRAADLSTRALASLENQNTQDNLELARATVIRADLELSWATTTTPAGTTSALWRCASDPRQVESRVAEARFDLGKVLALTGDRSGAFERRSKPRKSVAAMST
jgi:hypothetical protein